MKFIIIFLSLISLEIISAFGQSKEMRFLIDTTIAIVKNNSINRLLFNETENLIPQFFNPPKLISLIRLFNGSLMNKFPKGSKERQFG